MKLRTGRTIRSGHNSIEAAETAPIDPRTVDPQHPSAEIAIEEPVLDVPAIEQPVLDAPAIEQPLLDAPSIEQPFLAMSAILSATNNTGLAYPHPVLTKIIGKPTAVTLKTFTKELFTNARAIPSHHDDNRYGHLGLLMPSTPYEALPNATAWADVAAPGDFTPIPANTDNVEAANLIKTHEQNLSRYRLQLQVDTDLKAMIIAAIEPRFLAVQEDATMGFATKTSKVLYAYVMTTYGAVKQGDIEKNRERLSEDWSPDQPLEDLWKRAKTCSDFATQANEAIPELVQIRLLKKVLRRSGVFENAIDKWDDKTANNTTVAEFMAHFNTEDERRLAKLNARQAGYSTSPSANAAIATQTAFGQGYEKGWSAGLAAASHSANAAQGINLNDIFPNANAMECHAVSKGGVKFYYCHTHGLGRNKLHTSKTCNNPGEGHKKEATLDNMMGGSNSILSRSRRNRGGD